MCPLHAGCSVQALTGWSGSRSTWRRTHVRADRPASPLCDPRICSRAPLPAPCVGRRGLWRTPPPPRAISPLAEATVAVSLSARFALVSRSVYRSVCLFFSLFPSPLLSPADVAVKITPTSVVRSSCKEMTALSRLSNPHIVQLFGVQARAQAPKKEAPKRRHLLSATFSLSLSDGPPPL